MPDYLVTDPATGQRIKMSGPAPPSEALIRLALAKVKPLPSHVQQTPDPLQAMQKAQTIGPARVGERYQEDLNPSLVGIARKVLGGAQRPPSVAAEDPYGIGAWLKGAGPMPTPIAAEIQAYHGSPHDFEKFLLEKIGTGEGAQAYGHGLYFAENPAVAQEYRDKLGMKKTTVGGRDITNPQQQWASDELLKRNGDALAAKAHIDWLVEKQAFPQKYGDEIKQHIDAFAGLERKDVSTGKTYHVSIKADPDQFLDWDKPLSQQKHIPPELLDHLKRSISEEFTTLKDPSKATGADLYAALQDKAVNWKTGANIPYPEEQRAASEVLKQAGIPGIKYLDQGSRGWTLVKNDKGGFLRGFGSEAEATKALQSLPSSQAPRRVVKMPYADEWAIEGQSGNTSNYVVFDDKLIDILKKYAVAGAVGGSLASLGQPPAEEQK